MIEWDAECPELYKLHGPHLAPVWGMEPGPDRDGLCAMLELMRRHPVWLKRQKDEVIMQWDPQWEQHAEAARVLEEFGALLKAHYDAALVWLARD